MARVQALRPQAQRTRAAILEAAEALFSEQGFSETRLEDVAERVGIRRASIVYYFRDKRELYDVVLDEMFAELLRRCQAAVQEPRSLTAPVDSLVSTWLGYLMERPACGRILLREIASHPTRRYGLRRNLGPVMATFNQVLRDGVRQRIFQHVEPRHFMMLLGGVSLFFLFDSEGTPVDAGAREQHRDEVLRITRRLLGTVGPGRARVRRVKHEGRTG